MLDLLKTYAVNKELLKNLRGGDEMSDWTCPNCGATNPMGSDTCYSCCSAREIGTPATR